MHWLIFAAISVIAGAFSNLYEKIVLSHEKSDVAASAIAFQILTGGCYIVFALYSGFHIPSTSLIPHLLASAALYAAGTVYFFRAIKLIEASEMSIINGVGAIITIIVSIVFLKDSLSTQQLLGAACIFGAVVIINLKKKGFVINEGTWWALAGSTCYGIAVIFDAYIIRSFEAASFIPLSAASTAIMLMIWYYKKIPMTFHMLRQTNKNLWIFCVLYASSALAFYMGIQQGAMVGQMSTIYRATIIATVILSAFILKERKHLLRKIFAAILTTTGVLLVSS
jgi:transporter family protein